MESWGELNIEIPRLESVWKMRLTYEIGQRLAVESGKFLKLDYVHPSLAGFTL